MRGIQLQEAQEQTLTPGVGGGLHLVFLRGWEGLSAQAGKAPPRSPALKHSKEGLWRVREPSIQEHFPLPHPSHGQ